MPSVGTAYVSVRINTKSFESGLETLMARLSTKMEAHGKKLGKDFEKGLKETDYKTAFDGLHQAAGKAATKAKNSLNTVGTAADRLGDKVSAAGDKMTNSLDETREAASRTKDELDELGKAGTRAKNSVNKINLGGAGGGGGSGFRRATADANSFDGALRSIGPNMKRAAATFTYLHNMAAFAGTALAGLVGGLSAVAQGLFAVAANAAAMGPALAAGASGMLAMIQVAATLKLGLKGVMEAFKLGTKSQDAAAKSAGKAADNSKAIAAALRALRNAQDALGDAYRDAARAAEEAARKTLRAERQLAASMEELTAAQEALNEARKEALEQLEDIGFAAEDAALAEQRAALRLQEAQAELLAVSELAPDNRARIEAELAFKEAELNMRQAVDAREDADRAQQEAARTGIEGTEAMQSAREAEASATQAVRDDQEALADARRDEAEQAEDSADRIAEAQQAVADAQERLAEAYKGSAAGATAAATAADAFRKAMDKLGPNQQDFVEKMLGMKERMQEFRNAIAEPMFGKLNTAFDNFLKKGKDGNDFLDTMQDGLKGTGIALGDTAIKLSELAASDAFQGTLKHAMDENNKAITAFGGAGVSLVNIFVQLADAAAPILTEFAQWIEKMAAAKSASLTLGNQTGELDAKIRKGADKVKEFAALFKELWRWLKNTGKAASQAADEFAWTDKDGNAKTGFIPMLTENLKELNDAFNDEENKKKVEGFTQALKNMVEIGKAIKTVTQPFIDMGKDPKIAEAFKKISESKAFETLGKNATNALPQLTDIALNILDIIAALSESKSIETMLSILKDVSGVVSDIVKWFADITLPDGRKLLPILGMVTGFLSALKVIFWTIARLGGPTLKVSMLFKGLWGFVKLIGRGIGGLFGALGRAVPLLGRIFGFFGRILTSVANIGRAIKGWAKTRFGRGGGPTGGGAGGGGGGGGGDGGGGPDYTDDLNGIKAKLEEEFTSLKLKIEEEGTALKLKMEEEGSGTKLKLEEEFTSLKLKLETENTELKNTLISEGTKTRTSMETNTAELKLALSTAGGGAAGKGAAAAGAAPKAGATTVPMPKAPKGVKAAGAKIGADLTAGIVAGLREGSVAVNTEAGKVGRGAAAAVARGAQTASPSKLTFKTGDDLMDGLTLGIKEGQVAAVTAGRTAGAAAAGAVATGAKSQAGAVGAAGAGAAAAGGGVIPGGAGAAAKGGKMAGMFGSLGKAMGPITKLAKPMAGAMRLVGGAFSMMLGPVGMIAMTLIPILWPLIQKLNDKFKIMDKIMAGVSWAVDKVGEAFNWLLENVIQPVFDWLKDNWKNILTILTGPIGIAVRLITENWDKIKAAVEAAVEFVTDLLTTIWDGIMVGWEAITSFFSGLWTNHIQPIFQKIVDDAIAILTGIWDGITAGWDIVWGWLSGLWSSTILPWITEFVGFYYDIFLKIWDGIRAGWDAIWAWLSGLWEDTIKPWVDDLVARQIRGMKRIWNGITEGWTIMSRWVSNFWKDKLQPKIKYIVDKGKELLKSIWKGIQDGWTAVGTWISNLWANTIKPKLKTLKDNMVGYLKGVWAGLGSGLVTALNWVADKVNWMIGRINSVLSKFGSSGITWTWPHIEWNGFAQGGPVRGKGGPTSDSIPARLSNGEYVIPAKASKKLGPEALEYMRKYGKLPPQGGFGWDTLTAPFKAIGDVISKGAKIALQWVLSQVDDRLGPASGDNFVTKVLRAGLHWGADKIVGWGSNKDKAADGAVSATGTATTGVVSRGPNPLWNWPAAKKAPMSRGPGSHGRGWAVDFAVPSGTQLLAVSSGVVKHAGMGTSYNSTYGNYVQILGHPTGQKSLYAHMSQVSVKAGQRVVKGQILGLSGNTGHSTGPHLHFELNPVSGAGNVIDDMRRKRIYIGLAQGGVVSPKDGGIMAMIGEAGKSERVTPLDRDGFTPAERKIIATLEDKLTGGRGDTYQIHPSEKINEVALADLVARRVSWKRRRGAGR